MYEYSNNNFENHEQPGQYYNIPQHDAVPAAPSSPKSKKRRSSGRAGRMAKKVGAITLSAVLFGGVASGTFLAVNAAAGYSPSALKAAAKSAASADAASSQTASLMQTVSLNGTVAVNGSLDVTDIAAAVMPSIVSITNKSVQEVQTFFSMFGYGYQTQPQETESCGSGIIIGKNDTELLIVTNNHVIENADTLSACFIDNQAYEANVKGTDPDNDLAVIAIPLANISEDTLSQIAVASIGDSDSLQVGEQVVAIGNALGYGQSVTTGIVSATNRSFADSSSSETVNTSADSSDLPTYIQTDAAINPGNSGGALVNMKGEVIGINSAKIASSSVEGMGYAIPVSRVSDIIETLMNETTRTKVAESQKASIGISGITVNESVSQTYGIPEGVYIADVTEGGGAKAAGIVRGEVITKFDGKAITDISELQDLLQYYAAGETVEITLKVPGAGEYTERTVSVTLGQAAEAKEDNTPSTSDAKLPNVASAVPMK